MEHVGVLRKMKGWRMPPIDGSSYNAALDAAIAALSAPQPPAEAQPVAELVGLLDEVRSHFTRDDDLPGDLLPRIDAALTAQHGGKS